MMRLFLALFFDKASLAKLWDMMLPLKNRYPELRFESLEQLHVTLWFYGDQMSLAREAKIINTLSKLPAFSTLDVQMHEPVYLPFHKPHALAYRLEREQLLAIMPAIDQAMQQLGFIREREFLPHVTLARFATRLKALPELLPVMLKLKLNRLVLVESTQTSQGSIYQPKWERQLLNQGALNA